MGSAGQLTIGGLAANVAGMLSSFPTLVRLAAVSAAVFAVATVGRTQTPVVTFAGETMRLAAASVTSTGGTTYAVNLTMADDNGNGSLPTSFRRWWHCEIGSLNPAGTTLTVTVTNAGYSDVILPVWAQSSDGGQTFSSYARMPVSAVPTRPSSTSHRFTIATPPGVDTIRVAKYFPYSVTRKNAFVQSLATHPRVRSVTTIGASQLGRPIELIELTDVTVPDAGKKRVWIHTAVHPAETTSYFMTEGLIDWLGSGDPFAEVLLDHTIFDIVPMANPDGVVLGNYRTNANSVNLENEWRAPYNSTQPEIIALRTAIEGFMGTPAQPGSNPIVVVFNLHSTHNVAYPFHFRHTANANWSAGGNNSGVIPVVNALETDWIDDFRSHSPFVALGSTGSSSAGAPSRPFVESMMHDRWSALSSWTGAPAFEEPVMAITFEGTYGFGPQSGVWNTEADYELCGAQLGRALADYLDVQPTAQAVNYGAPCTALTLGGITTPVAGGHNATLGFAFAAPTALAIIGLGFQQTSNALPAPWQACLSRTSLDATTFVPVNALGMGQFSLLLPPWPGLSVSAQAFAFDFSGPNVLVDTSNGVEVRNNF